LNTNINSQPSPPNLGLDNQERGFFSSNLEHDSSRETDPNTIKNNSNPLHTDAEIRKQAIKSLSYHNVVLHKFTPGKPIPYRSERASKKAKEHLSYWAGDLEDYIKSEWKKYKKETNSKVICLTNGKEVIALPYKTRFALSYQKQVVRAIKRIPWQHYSSAVKQELEFDANRYTIEESWEIAPKELNRYLTGLFKKIGRRIPYLVTLEAHESGYPHFHVVFFGVRRIEDWRKLAKRWGCGFQNIKRTSPYHGVEYATKYITKTLATSFDDRLKMFLWFFNRRAIHNSRGLMPPINKMKEASNSTDWVLCGVFHINENYTNGFKEWLIEVADMAYDIESWDG
jgi:hypothetical protein